MKIQSLKFTTDPGHSFPLKTNLEIGSPQEFEKLRHGTLPVAYLVIKEHLTTIYGFNDLVINRGTKNKSKGLFDYFSEINNDKILVIDVNYDQGGRLASGIKKLLFKASKNKKRNVFIIGAEKNVFDETWNNAHDDIKEETGEKDKKGKKPYPDIGDVDASMCELYEELIKRCDVPKELEEKYVGKSGKVDLVRRLIVLAARKDMPVLIQGDSGTGKEDVAEGIHNLYKNIKNKSGKLIKVNCPGIPPDLLEMELFGVEPNVGVADGPKGKPKIGLWELANDGTLFLDEIADIHPRHQAKILRALENNVIRRVGGIVDIPVNARVVAATNHDLAFMVQNGRFREDLYYRLRGFLIHTPALKDHPEDIPLLAEFFWKKIRGNKDNNKTLEGATLRVGIMDELQLFRWPGNVRELKAVLNRLDTLCEGKEEITVKDIKHALTIEGQTCTTQSMDMSERGIDLLRGDCWRHLKRVDDVIRAAKFDIELMVRRKDPKKVAAAVLNYLEYHLGELKVLCGEHFLFHSLETFSAVSRFTERLKRFHDLLHDNASKAKGYWKENLSEEFETVLSAIFKEVERVLG